MLICRSTALSAIWYAIAACWHDLDVWKRNNVTNKIKYN